MAGRLGAAVASILAAWQTSAAVVPDPQAAAMVALYEQVCLRAFPDDAAVDAETARKGMTPLSVEDVKITLGDDPGRGWRVASDRQAYIFLELPPFHACSVRWSIGEDAMDLAPYRATLARYLSDGPRTVADPTGNVDRGAIHIHSESEARRLPGGRIETFMAIDQHVIDPARRARGETGTELRLVRQIIHEGR